MLPLVVKLAYKSEPLSRRDWHGVKALEVVKVVKDRLQSSMRARRRSSTPLRSCMSRIRGLASTRSLGGNFECSAQVLRTSDRPPSNFPVSTDMAPEGEWTKSL